MSRVANLRIVRFSKPKPARNPLQRLNDQRRSLALAGLAAGAVLSAAVFRRKRRGVQDELREPVPVFERPAAQPESGPPAAVAVPRPPSDSTTAGPIAAAAAGPTPLGNPAETKPSSAAGPAEAEAAPASGAPEPSTASAPPEGEPEVTETAINAPEPATPSASSEPATGELSAEEASILAVLAQSGRTDDDRTALAVATSLERETTDVAGVLRKLGAEGVVSGELYTAAGDKIWAVTERGVRRLGAQS